MSLVLSRCPRSKPKRFEMQFAKEKTLVTTDHERNKRPSSRIAVCLLLFAIVFQWTALHSQQNQTELPINLQGDPIDPLADVTSRAVVLIFVAVDCPISNRYAPVINSIAKRFADDVVAFWMVYADPGTSPEAIRRHRKEYAITLPALRDPAYFLVQRANAEVTRKWRSTFQRRMTTAEANGSTTGASMINILHWESGVSNPFGRISRRYWMRLLRVLPWSLERPQRWVAISLPGKFDRGVNPLLHL